MKDPHDTQTPDLHSDAATSEAPGRRGRPAKHASAAERQKAYRARLKEKGMREVKRMVRDVRDAEAPLASDVIDLSEVRRRK